MISLEKAKQLEKEAEDNGGRCTHCQHTIKIYEYPVNRVMVKFLRQMAEQTDNQQDRAVDVEKVSVIHHERTQITKLRIHGLIAKVKDENGHHQARMWLITHKGWQFLRGEPIPRKVVIYNNQVLGHTGGETTIKRIDADSSQYEQGAMTEPEAKMLGNVREEPVRMQEHSAHYRGISGEFLLKGSQYTIMIERLVMGRPVRAHVIVPSQLEPIKLGYPDIAAFHRSWQILD